MTTCKYCGQEIIQADFEGQFDICTDCILSYSRNYGAREVGFLCFIVVQGMFFFVSFLQLVVNIPHFLSNVEQNYPYFIVNLVVTIVSGGILAFSILISKRKSTRRHLGLGSKVGNLSNLKN